MSTEVQPGQILAGKFRIERVLGQGGMGVVVAATHLQLDERVALKFLLPEALGNAEAVARFAREARAAVKIKSEHVARVSDVGTLESGSPYMVMEYLEGQDLAERVRMYGAMSPPAAIELVLQACEAIAEAHALGIVHRDLKPANLFVTQRMDGSPSIKVLDFGISKITVVGSDSDMGMTKTSTVMGSPLYMSPEQMSSTRNVDARTDIWALGVILYEVLTGRVPFEAETMPQLCGMILQDPVRPLRELRPDVPEGLQNIVFRCLEKKREARFANVAELASALSPYGGLAGPRSAERIARVLGTSGAYVAPTAFPVVSQGETGASTAASWTGATATRKSKGPLFALLVAGLLVLAGVIVFVNRKKPVTSPVDGDSSAQAAAQPAVPAPPAPVTAAPTVMPIAEVPASAGSAASPPASAAASASAAAERAKAAIMQGKSQRVRPTTRETAETPRPALPPSVDPLDGRR